MVMQCVLILLSNVFDSSKYDNGSTKCPSVMLLLSKFTKFRSCVCLRFALSVWHKMS